MNAAIIEFCDKLETCQSKSFVSCHQVEDIYRHLCNIVSISLSILFHNHEK
jgi:hypothetical protein